MVSWLPLTTRAGWVMARRVACSGSRVAHQVITALACGSVTALPFSVSRSSVRTLARVRNARPADWLADDFVKNSGKRGSMAPSGLGRVKTFRLRETGDAKLNLACCHN